MGRTIAVPLPFNGPPTRGEPSLLSYADKLATILVPRWLYLHQINATGESQEYLEHFRKRLASNATASPALQDVQHPPKGIVYGSIDHWYWAITRKYTPSWIEEKQRGGFLPSRRFALYQMENMNLYGYGYP
jgi:hypothetical protein